MDFSYSEKTEQLRAQLNNFMDASIGLPIKSVVSSKQPTLISRPSLQLTDKGRLEDEAKVDLAEGGKAKSALE